MSNFNMTIFYAILWAVSLCLVGGLMTPRGGWYENLRKPAWQPPAWAFGPGWTTILALAAWAAVRAWDAGDARQQRDVLILFGVTGLFHLLWSPLFFRLQRPDWALIEVPFLWFSVLALIVGLWPIDQLAALLILPDLAWVAFASTLNWAVVQLNPGAF